MSFLGAISDYNNQKNPVGLGSESGGRAQLHIE
jgi:hypothetical protein